MPQSLYEWSRLIFIGLSLFCAKTTFAKTHLRLATYEVSPYVSSSMTPGIFSEIVSAALQEAGYDAQREFFPYRRAIKLVESGEVHLMGPVLDANAEYLLSDEIAPAELGFLIPRDKKFDKTSEQRNSENFALSSQISNDSLSRQLDMLNQGRLTSIRVEKFIAADVLTTQRPHMIRKLKFVPENGTKKSFRLAISKKYLEAKEFLRKFNEALQKLEKNGRKKKILESYGYFDNIPIPGSLKIAAPLRDDTLLLKRLSSYFLKRHPSLNLKWIFMEDAMISRRILRSMAFGEAAFDVLTLGHFEAPIYRSHDWISSLRNLGKDYDIGDILKEDRLNVSSDGKDFFALPFTSEVLGTYYRTDLFAAKGLTMPKSPSYKDIEDKAARLHNPSEGVYGICMRTRGSRTLGMDLIPTIAISNGARWFDKNWRPQISSPEWKEAVTTYIELLRNYGPPRAEDLGYEENLRLFLQGRCAIWIDSTVALGTIRSESSSRVGDRFALVDSPYMKRKTGNSAQWVWALAVPKSSTNRTASEDFIAWATSKDYVNLVGDKAGWAQVPVGVRLSTHKDTRYREAEPYGNFILSTIQNMSFPLDVFPILDVSRYPQMIEVFPAVSHAFSIQISRALKSEVSAEEAVMNTQAEAQQVLYQSGLFKGKEVK